jgi:protein-S-isoprenylcysteine O-methyltransferase Ste14
VYGWIKHRLFLAGLVLAGRRGTQMADFRLSSIGGGASNFLGALLLMAAIFRLRLNLAAVPYPKELETLIETGPYRVVRHPMHCSGIFIAV